jgi:hypothetical protein
MPGHSPAARRPPVGAPHAGPATDGFCLGFRHPGSDLPASSHENPFGSCGLQRQVNGVHASRQHQSGEQPRRPVLASRVPVHAHHPTQRAAGTPTGRPADLTTRRGHSSAVARESHRRVSWVSVAGCRHPESTPVACRLGGQSHLGPVPARPDAGATPVRNSGFGPAALDRRYAVGDNAACRIREVEPHGSFTQVRPERQRGQPRF